MDWGAKVRRALEVEMGERRLPPSSARLSAEMEPETGAGGVPEKVTRPRTEPLRERSLEMSGEKARNQERRSAPSMPRVVMVKSGGRFSEARLVLGSQEMGPMAVILERGVSRVAEAMLMAEASGSQSPETLKLRAGLSGRPARSQRWTRRTSARPVRFQTVPTV